MSYKTIVLHLEETDGLEQRIRYAAALALREQAHLIGVALTGISRYLYQDQVADQDDPHLALHLNMLRTQARRALAGFSPLMEQLGVHSHEQLVVDDEAASGLSQAGRCADLLVMGQSPAQRGKALLGDLPGDVLMQSGRPLLLLPPAPEPDRAPARILIAWDHSKEAARAVTAALPLLQGAAEVSLALIDQDAEPGAALQRHLARHGVAARLLHDPPRGDGRRRRPEEVGAALLGLASVQACQLLVMGAYGHSRFRETLLGGVTRTLLASMTLPLLLAH